jgi:hypothetical protein
MIIDYRNTPIYPLDPTFPPTARNNNWIAYPDLNRLHLNGTLKLRSRCTQFHLPREYFLLSNFLYKGKSFKI